MSVRYSFKVTGTLAAFNSWKNVANMAGQLNDCEVCSAKIAENRA